MPLEYNEIMTPWSSFVSLVVDPHITISNPPNNSLVKAVVEYNGKTKVN